MSYLTDNDFKVTIINMFKELKQTRLQEVKEDIKTMFHQIENINIHRHY